MNDLRNIPSVDQIIHTQKTAELIAQYGRPLTLEAVRASLATLRSELLSQETQKIPSRFDILQRVELLLSEWLSPTLVPVINATGVVLHTNLGRAPLSKFSLQALSATSSGYATLEYDLNRGVRGSRAVHAERYITRLTGAEAAMVVNNNAAAVMLILACLAKKKRVIIARSQLIEIGGGFRIPDVMNQSGAKLVEVGTTNRVNLEDYQQVIQEPAALIFHAHHSNFKIIGFTVEPSLEELVNLGKKFNVLVVEDLGSGALLDTARFGLAHEPTVQEAVQQGADLVCFSGDKLLGGPQAGIIVGKSSLINLLKKHPLARAIRADKLCLAALSATLTHYLKDEAEREIPVWQMISSTPELTLRRARHWAAVLGIGTVIEGKSAIGGGSLPEELLPTYLVAFSVRQPNQILERLRRIKPPIIARVQDDQVVIDPRTVLPEQEGALLVGLQNVLREKG
jgi:L-seryl-tRNA(Ser) seleniumtransferase